ncbi:hypothetical protein ACFLZX_04810 [Nanoarchaeota archaeon]
MPFSKNFPRTIKGSSYPKWEEVTLSPEEERDVERISRVENISLMKECIEDAKGIMESQNLKKFQTNMVDIAISLFEKRASHTIYWKENKAKEKFSK